jgi:hypothetical protein
MAELLTTFLILVFWFAPNAALSRAFSAQAVVPIGRFAIQRLAEWRFSMKVLTDLRSS